MFKFDLQLFADGIDIPGIDEDILKELGDDMPAPEETPEEKPEEKPEPQEQPPVDADNVNKQVEEKEDEYDDVKEGQTIPYTRFQSVNERRKNAEQRIKELEERIKNMEAAPKAEPQAAPEPVGQSVPVQVNMYDYTAEQRKKIGELALQRVKSKMNLSDEDVEAMEYADDPTEKLMYQSAIAQETQNISREIQEYKAKQSAEQKMYETNATRFEELNKKVTAYPDAQARIDFILNENFVKLDAEKRAILQESYLRLQNKQGTNADFRLVNSYINKANKLWEDAHKPAEQPATNTNNKITQAQKLPKAPNLNGGGGAEKSYTIEDLTNIMNTPGGWEGLPQAVKDAIMKGNLPV